MTIIEFQPLHMLQRMPAPTFRGAEATRRVQTERTYLKKDLLAVACRDTDPYIGEVPSALLAATGLSREQFLKRLDRAARSILRSGLQYEPDPPNGKPFRDNNRRSFGSRALFPSVWKRLGQWLKHSPKREDSIRISYFNSGCVGHLFTLGHGEKHYIFKVSRHIDGDIGNGAYFTALGTSDIPQFYVGNPKRNWALMEMVDANMTLQGRPGKRLREHGYHLHDRRPENYVGLFTVDLEQVMKPRRI